MIEHINLLEYIEHYSYSYMIADYQEHIICYTNKKAEETYGITEETIDLEPIFRKHTCGLYTMFLEQLKNAEKETVLISDVVTVKKDQSLQLTDLRLGYFNREKHQVFIEIAEKEDNRLDTIQRQMDISIHPQGMMSFDTSFTVTYCNENMKKLLGLRVTHGFADCFLPEEKQEVQSQLYEALLQNPYISKKVKLRLDNGTESWFVLELSRCALDLSGVEQVNLTLFHQEQQMNMELELANLNQYFGIFQSLSEGLLYRLDIQERVLYRNEKMAEKYNFPDKESNFPSKDWLNTMIHQEDHRGILEFVDRLYAGKEGVHMARLKGISGRFEYHKFVFKCIHNGDGTVKEMIGCATNVHELHETQAELDDIGQYFDILQSMSKGLLYRFDIENRILFRNAETARAYQIPTITENFPPRDWLEKMIHPEDVVAFESYIERVVEGKEGSHIARFSTAKGDLEYHKFTFKALRRVDGTVKEMVGCAMNVHHLKETEKELENISGYFSILQTMTHGMLYRLDVKNRILYRDAETAKFYQVPAVAKDYPDSEQLKGVFHEDDISDYIRFIEFVLSGGEGSHLTRLRTPAGKYEYHRITFKALRGTDGSVREMIGQAVNVNDLKETQKELEHISGYFSILQTMTNGMLYRLDIKNRILYRDEETAKFYKVPAVATNYPDVEQLKEVFHPDDISDYVRFIEFIISGGEGTHITRIFSPSGHYEYHRFTFKALQGVDGSVREMIGQAVNIHDLKETQEELDQISGYFSILQSMTKGMLYRLDIQNRILYRDEETAKFYHVPAVAENYPDPEKLRGVFHPDDISAYVKFIEYVMTGGEGTHTTRLFSPSGKFEYHNVTFKALRGKNGSIREMIGQAVNVQDYKETKDELTIINQYFNILQSFSNDLLYRLDIKNRILYRNESTSQYYGIKPKVENYPSFESLEGVFHPEDIPEYAQYIERVLQGEEDSHTARLLTPTGSYEYHKFSFKQLKGLDGSVTEMVGHAVNIHSLMALETKATYDMLTHCLNKISFEEQTTGILQASTLRQRHCLIFVDLDDFKGINDNLGHSFGDFLLETVGMRLKKLVREGDLVGRAGGDEFILFLESCGDDIQLQSRGQEILEALREEYLQDATSATIRGSVGMAVFPNHGTTYHELYVNADKALYHSKHLGKDVVTIYHKGIS